MAAITAPTIYDDIMGGALNGCRLRKIYITTNAASTSTWESGIDAILEMAWFGDTATDYVRPTSSGTTITFTNASAITMAGYLYVWSRS